MFRFTLFVQLHFVRKITHCLENYTLHTIKLHTFYGTTHFVQFYCSLLDKLAKINRINKVILGDFPRIDFGDPSPYLPPPPPSKSYNIIWAYGHMRKIYAQAGYPRKEHQKCSSETLSLGP